MRIELCGGTASGKTTFASVIKKYFSNVVVVFEEFASCGLLNDFYYNTSYYAFETEIFFLIQHMHQIKVAKLMGLPIICDYSIEQDYAYTKHNLYGNSWSVFDIAYKETINQIGNADLIIFLDCPTNTLLKRIKNRGRASETNINADYLDGTIKCLKNRLKQLSTDIVVIDSNLYDFRNKIDFDEVLNSCLKEYKYILGK